MIKQLILSIILISIFGSCQKKDSCDSPEELFVYINENIYEGWPLELSFSTDFTYNVEIIGPNGFKKNYSSVQHFSQNLIDTTTMADNGEYTINIWGEKCLVSTRKVNVQILSTPAPPCTIANNTGTTTIGQIGGTSYSNVTSNTGLNYRISGTYNYYNAINFNFNSKPIPGKYKSGGSYYPDTEAVNQCSVHIQTSYNDFFILNGQDIYVTEENGKLAVTMCSSEFSNSISTTPLYISAKLVLP